MPNRKRRIASTLGLLVAGIGLALPGGSGAQTPTPFDLVLDPLPDISGSPPPGVEAVFEITFDHHGLELAPEEVRIDLPAPDGTIIATKRPFSPTPYPRLDWRGRQRLYERPGDLPCARITSSSGCNVTCRPSSS